ncbi:MAG: type VI secretion system baseplate subunit TssG [Pseudomonadota bacterium]
MATTIWRSGTSLKTALGETPERFDFFQAVRLLQQARGHRLAVGESATWGAEAVEFASEIGFAFAPSDIKTIELDSTADKPTRMVVRHLTLAGAFGPLPATFGERLLQGARQDSPHLLQFLDIFHHRLIALLFRAKQRSRPALRSDAPWQHPLADSIFALIGLATKGQRQRLVVEDQSLLGYGGMLADRRRSSHSLERLIAEHFKVSVSVRQFIGKWWPLMRSQCTILGSSGQNNRLGKQTLLGQKAWNQSAALRLDIGPLDREKFDGLLPKGSNHDAFKALVLFVTDRRFDIAVRLLPAPQAVTQLKLRSSKLGYNSWLGRCRGSDGTPPKAASFRFLSQTKCGGGGALRP